MSNTQQAQQDREAQQKGREDGLKMGRAYVEWLDDSGQLAGPVMLVELDGVTSGYMLRGNVRRVAEGRVLRDAIRFARRYAVNFCVYFDLAVLQLTGANAGGVWWEWYAPAELRELLDAPDLSEDAVQEAWAKYRAGRWAASLPMQEATHPEWRLPLDTDTGESEAQP